MCSVPVPGLNTNVADLLLSSVLWPARLKLQQFIVAARGSPQLAGLRGYLFELYSHRMLHAGRKSCLQDPRQLEPAEELPGAAKRKPVWSHMLSRLRMIMIRVL
jgi:hypothetical protein